MTKFTDYALDKNAVEFKKEAMREEAVQLAGVCIRFIQECCEI